MKEHDGDPLERLRDAWRSDAEQDAAPLPPAFESSSLDDEDPLTRAAVEWLRDAHAARTTPAAEMPLRLRRAARRRAPHSVGRHLRWIATLAAAAALAVLFVEWPGRSVRDEWTRPSVEVAEFNDSDPVHRESVDDVDRTASMQPSPANVAPLDRASVRDIPPDRFHLRDDGIELVSGRVRLVLLDR